LIWRVGPGVRARMVVSMKFASAIVWLVVAGCGRIHFAERATGDGSIDTPSGPRFTRITAYGDLTCAEFSGRLYCWGENGSRQLGDGTTMDRGAPTAVSLPAGALGAFTVGETHGCAIVDGTLFCWGDTTNTQSFTSPTMIGSPVSDVAAGKRFTCAVVGTQVKCWGVNDAGQLGDSTLTSRDTLAPIINDQGAVEVDAGDDHACARTPSNTALCWGHNDDGALGSGSFTPATTQTPLTVTNGITTLPRIAGWHACTLRGTEVWCWGRNMEGALGDGSVVPKAAPQVVPNFDSASLVATGGGPTDLDATCAIRMGDLYCWGAGTGGRLGTGAPEAVILPTKVGNLPGPVTDVALGYAHTCALLADGDIWCWGRGTSGQLGDGKLSNSFTPVRVVPPMTGA